VSPDLVVHDTTVVSPDRPETVTENAVVAVTDGTITALEPDDRVPDAETVIDGTDTVLVPGLVNAHAHLELSPLLGLFSDFEGLNLFAVAARLFFELDDAEWRQLSRAGGRLVALSMLSSGITTVNSMDRTPTAFADALGESGMRAVLGPMISDVFLPESRPVSSSTAPNRSSGRTTARTAVDYVRAPLHRATCTARRKRGIGSPTSRVPIPKSVSTRTR